MGHAALGKDCQPTSWLASANACSLNKLIDNLFQDSRDAHHVFFQPKYPVEALIDDMSVSQPLELFHECAKLRHLLQSSRAKTEIAPGVAVTASSFLGMVATTGKVSGLCLPSIVNRVPIWTEICECYTGCRDGRGSITAQRAPDNILRGGRVPST